MRLGASREWRKSELVVKDGLVVGDFVHEGADLLVLRVIDVGVQILQGIENRVDADVKDIALVDIVANRGGFDLRDDGLQVLGLLGNASTVARRSESVPSLLIFQNTMCLIIRKNSFSFLTRFVVHPCNNYLMRFDL